MLIQEWIPDAVKLFLEYKDTWTHLVPLHDGDSTVLVSLGEGVEQSLNTLKLLGQKSVEGLKIHPSVAMLRQPLALLEVVLGGAFSKNAI